jgi:Tn3 transposase DDE domain
VLNGVEHVHRFTRAMAVGNLRELLQAEKDDQEMAEACKRLIKNCIICWNYSKLPSDVREIKIISQLHIFPPTAAGYPTLFGDFTDTSVTSTLSKLDRSS